MGNLSYITEFYSVWTKGNSLYTKWSSKHGISYPEMSVLYALLIKESITQKEISEAYGLTKQTVNHYIHLLNDKKHVRLEVRNDNRREKMVLLTTEGKRYAEKILKPLFEIEAYISRNISSEKFIQAMETRELFNTLFEKAMEKEE